ncbi:MAG: hypothetical protein U0441_04215 [Polyangiaceae bacterium]
MSLPRSCRGLAGVAIVAASLLGSAAALAQSPYGSSPGQYSPYPQQPGQYSPYGAPQPYAQPGSYGTSQQPNGYVPLGGNSQDITSDNAHSWPILRVAAGAGLTFGPDKHLYSSAIVDATLGYRWALARRFSLAVEGGYSWDSEPLRGGNYGVLGVGPELYAGRYLQFSWNPKAVIGGAWSGFGIGVRNTLMASFFMHTVNVEIGHQFLHVGRDDRNELRAQISFDLAGLAQLVLTRTLSR